MMSFRTIDNALTSLLEANANGLFHVERAQRRAIDGNYLAQHPIVTVFFQGGQFPKGAGGLAGPRRHDMTFEIQMIVAAAATMDLRILNDPNSSTQAIMSAIAASTSAASNADDILDEILEAVYQIICDPRNLDLGLAKGFVSNQWVGNFTKEQPLPHGEYVILAGSWSYTCSAFERTVGATPIALGGIDTTITETADITDATTDSATQGAKVGT